MSRSARGLLLHPRSTLRAARIRFLPRVLRAFLRPNRRGLPLVRVGSEKGGWVLPVSRLNGGGVCYCFGLGTDATFELELAGRTDLEIHTFDPTPAAVDYAAVAFEGYERITFHPLGIWNVDGPQQFFVPRDPRHVSHSLVNLQGTERFFVAECRRLASLMRDLGHGHVDIVKMDIEGAELAVLDDILATEIRPGTICVEFDQPNPVRSMLGRLQSLREAGYALVAIDRWNYTFVRKGPSV